MHVRVSARYLSLLSALVLMALPVGLRSQPVTLSADELVKQSEIIVVGKVHGLVSEWTANRQRIQTRVTVSVDETVKGAAPGATMTVIVPGGEVDGVGEWYSHTAKFDRDEDVLLFAKKDNNGQFRVAGGQEGKFSVKKDLQSGVKMIPKVGTLGDFTSKIRNIMKSQEGNSIK